MVVMVVAISTMATIVMVMVFFVFFMFRWFVVLWPWHISAMVTAVVMSAPTVVISIAIVGDSVMDTAVRFHYNISVFARYSHYNLRLGSCGAGCYSRQ